jgi:molybdopterin synthase sulfur carrier subunit
MAGKESIEVDIREGGKILDLVKEVSDRVGKAELQKALLDPELNDPRPNNVILVNGREINSLNGLETVLREGDEITVIPLIHGGQ